MKSTSEPTSAQETLGRFWSELLGVENVQPDDDFFTLGGKSLQAVKFLLRVRRELGVDLPAPLFFKNSTLRQCAEAVEAAR
ncbi:phosphopantetheine-binding protein [Streptomyces sp. NPDC050732]|uniref:phosphopantetheine-binding protein n=1 Tax=Streptomyces sp. NPDC050732 TaxID=3154632 RepID=UPI003419EB29